MKKELHLTAIDHSINSSGDIVVSMTVTGEHKQKATQLVYEIKQGLSDGKKAFSCVFDWIRKKRSLDANAYMWVLLQKMADVLGSTKEEIKVEMLHKYSTFQTCDDGDIIVVSVQSRFKLVGEQYELYKAIGTGEANGKEFTHYAILKSSSQLDTHEFWVLLNGIISECKEHDIETMTPRELALLEEEHFRGKT